MEYWQVLVMERTDQGAFNMSDEDAEYMPNLEHTEFLFDTVGLQSKGACERLCRWLMQRNSYRYRFIARDTNKGTDVAGKAAE